MSTPATLNGLRVVRARLVTPWRGVWIADVDLDPDDPTAVPSGKVSINVLGATLSGTVDPLASGRFASSIRLRVVGGANGWGSPVVEQGFHNDAGITSDLIFKPTAALVGETVNDATPTKLGIDFVRSAGPASRVFGSTDWYVDPSGVTQTGARPTAKADASVEILSFDGDAQRLEVATDALLLPGTTFTDARFDGTLIARDVEQIVSKDGSRASVWCSPLPTSRLADALATFAREKVGVLYLRRYVYRVVTVTASRFNLQVVDKTVGLPDLLLISVWPGAAGASCLPTLGQSVRVGFFNGDKTKPFVDGFDATPPREATYDATAAVHIGPSAPSVDLAGGTDNLVLKTPYNALLQALTSFASGAASATTAAQIATAAGTLATALGGLPAPATTKTKAA